MSNNLSGRTIYGRIVNAVLTTATEITWEDKNGNSVTLAAGDRVNIVDLVVSTDGTAKDIIIFQDNDGDNALDSGEEIIPPLEFAGQGTLAMQFGLDVSLQKINAALTNGLHAVASAAGNCSILVTATITRT